MVNDPGNLKFLLVGNVSDNFGSGNLNGFINSGVVPVDSFTFVVAILEADD